MFCGFSQKNCKYKIQKVTYKLFTNKITELAN